MTSLKEGDKAPFWRGLDQGGISRSSEDYLGKWTLLYFYPKDDTPGCTIEACSIRDSYSDYEKNGINVIGVSGDSVESHSNFASKFKLPFNIIADGDKSILRAYGVLKEKTMFGRKFVGIVRMSYLIDSEGIIRKIYPKVKPQDHASQVLKDVHSLSVASVI